MGLELIVSNISKTYNGKEVIKDCSVSFKKSGIYVIMAPNGSGKSTFLRICCLLEYPDEGDISYFSNSKALPKDINLQRKITLLLPEIGVFNTTVFKNVAYGLKIRGVKKKDIVEKVEKALDFVGLLHKINQNALTLSSGEIKRMGIARAIVIEPEIIFLDEPTASVDKDNTELIENILIDLKKKLNTIIVFTTHDFIQAKRIGDFFLIINNHKIDNVALSDLTFYYSLAVDE